jgi:hypothetical protein
MPSKSGVLALSWLFLQSVLLHGAEPQISITKEQPGAARVRGSDSDAERLQIEASTNLNSWTVLASTNGTALEFLETQGQNFSRRFFRAAAHRATAAGTLQFVSPTNNAILTTNLPTLELGFSGLSVNTSNLVIRLDGTNLSVTPTITSNRATFKVLSPLPEGFVTLYAAFLPADGTAGPLARLDLIVLTSATNLPPVTQADFRNTSLGTAVSVPVLENDRDPNADALTIGSFTQGTNGSVTFANGIAAYTPRAGFVGEDQFLYTGEDGRGGTNAAQVRIFVTAAAELIAYVVDEPVLPNEFREIHEALGYLCNGVAAGGRRGRVIVRTERNLSVSTLRITCPVEISRDDDRGINLSGAQVTVISEADLTLAGMNISAGQITFDAGADLNLFRMNFSGPALIRLRGGAPGVGALRAAEAGGRQNANLIGFQGPAVTASFEGRAPNAKIAMGESGSLAAEGTIEGGGSVAFEAVKNDRMALRLGLKGGVDVSLGSVVTAGVHEERFDVTADNRLRINSVLAGRLEMDFREAGRLEVEAKNVRSQTWNNKFDANVTQTVDESTTAELNYTLGNSRNSLTATVDHKRAAVSGNLELVSNDQVKAKVGFTGAKVGKNVSVVGRGELELQLAEGFRVGLKVEAAVETGKTVFDFKNGELPSGLKTTVSPSAAFDMGLVGLEVGAPVDIVGTDGAMIGAAFAIDSHFQPASKVRVFVGLGGLRGLAQNPGTAGEFVITNCQFTAAPGSGAPIDIFGLDIPVRIENNTIRAAPWGMVLGEIDAAVTIRSNILINGGIGIDGDIEGEGRPGKADGPYLIHGNTIREGYPLNGITIQDVKYAVVEGNDIAALSGVVVSAGYTIVTNNIFDASTNGAVAIRASSGPGGPAALIASSNIVTGATPLILMPDSYSRFERNRFLSVVPAGSYEDEPISAIVIGNGLGTCSAVFQENQFSDVNIAANGATYFKAVGNSGTFKEIGIFSLPGLSSGITGAVIENNQLSGDFPTIQVDARTSFLMRGNVISDLDLSISGSFGQCFAVVEGNTFGGASYVSSSTRGYLRLSGNTFGVDGGINDSGFLVNNPGQNSINTENISSPLDFNGDADHCVDYPTPEFNDDPDDDPCSNGTGPRPPSAPAIEPPVEPPWPVF